MLLLLQIGEIASRYCISYTLRFLVKVHCTFARSFNEHPNSLSLRTLICNTFIEGHPDFLQLLPFLSPYSSCTVFWASSFHLSVSIVVLHQFMVPGHVYRKRMKREVSRMEKKVQDCYYVFGSSMTFQRRKEWICKGRCCRQVSVHLYVFRGIFLPLNPSMTTVYARSAFYPSLRFTLSLQSAFYRQSAFYPWSAVCSPQSAVFV